MRDLSRRSRMKRRLGNEYVGRLSWYPVRSGISRYIEIYAIY